MHREGGFPEKGLRGGKGGGRHSGHHNVRDLNVGSQVGKIGTLTKGERRARTLLVLHYLGETIGRKRKKTTEEGGGRQSEKFIFDSLAKQWNKEGKLGDQ